MRHLFRHGRFALHSGRESTFKIDCDALIWDDWSAIARLVAAVQLFSKVVGVPTGGLVFAKALEPYCRDGYGVLIVDDVLTTGGSMERLREQYPGADGVVLFARGRCPEWILPVFQLSSAIAEAEHDPTDQ